MCDGPKVEPGQNSEATARPAASIKLSEPPPREDSPWRCGAPRYECTGRANVIVSVYGTRLALPRPKGEFT